MGFWTLSVIPGMWHVMASGLASWNFCIATNPRVAVTCSSLISCLGKWIGLLKNKDGVPVAARTQVSCAR